MVNNEQRIKQKVGLWLEPTLNWRVLELWKTGLQQIKGRRETMGFKYQKKKKKACFPSYVALAIIELRPLCFIWLFKKIYLFIGNTHHNLFLLFIFIRNWVNHKGWTGFGIFKENFMRLYTCKIPSLNYSTVIYL